ncbi:MAG TPA: LysR family transcriptional regulator [Thermodesulfobacteriaceae bacterium]|nr:LysR family transcriptional regulator [Thermodesulfobacteriaceae bacterium]
MIDLRKLEALVAVVENRSFSKAAERIYLTQPTISGHIKSLEEYFGLKLFDRHTRAVTPTRAGKLLYGYAKKLLLIYKEMEREMAYFKGEKIGKLDLGGSTIPGQYILPYLIAEFRRNYLEISIFVKVGDTEEIIELVKNGELEVGMVGAREEDQELFFEPCCEDEIILIGSRNLDIPSEIKVSDLSSLPIIAREAGSGTWRTVWTALEKKGYSPEKLQIVAEMGSTEAVKQAAKAGLGLAFVSKLAVKEELASGELKIVYVKDLPLKRKFFLVYPVKRTLSPLAKAFLNFGREKIIRYI